MTQLAGSWFSWPAVLVLAAAVGCGGGNAAPKDAGADGGMDARPDAVVGDVASEAGNDAASEAGTEVAMDVGGDVVVDAGTEVAMDGGNDVASDAATDAVVDTGTDVAIDATGDATDGPSIIDAPTEEGPPPIVMLTVDALQNSIVLDRCTGLTPATFVDVAAGAHTIALTASTLSKGSVSAPDDTPLPSFDDFVIINVPVPAGAPASRRFFTLNGVGATANFTLSAVSTLRMMFIDSDTAANSGQGTVTLDTTGPSATVEGATNVIAYNTGCGATPASISVSDRPHRATLTESTLSAGGGSKDDFVLLRLPSETPMDPVRYVIMNGVGANFDFTPYNSRTLRGWFISQSDGASGSATIVISDL